MEIIRQRIGKWKEAEGGKRGTPDSFVENRIHASCTPLRHESHALCEMKNRKRNTLLIIYPFSIKH